MDIEIKGLAPQFFEYMLVIDLPPDLRQKVEEERQRLVSTYSVLQPQTGRPAVALVRFMANEMMEAKIIRELKLLAIKEKPFLVELVNYGSYPMHAVFIEIANQQRVLELVKSLKQARPLMKGGPDEPHFLLDPQVVLAGRLPKEQYLEIDPEETSSLYYQFNIDVVGWYNIDALLNTFDNKTETELRVRLIGTYKASLSVNLVVPVINTFLEGGKLSGNEGDYGFYTKDGKIPLPENAKAYIIVMGEADGQLLYAKKEFIVSKQQRIEIEAQPATTEEFNASTKAIGSANINIKATETQTGKDLKENEKQIQEAEKLKPKRCSCDCGSLK